MVGIGPRDNVFPGPAVALHGPDAYTLKTNEFWVSYQCWSSAADCADRHSVSSNFQAAGPATANARRPYVLRLCRGTTRWWWLAERGWNEEKSARIWEYSCTRCCWSLHAVDMQSAKPALSTLTLPGSVLLPWNADLGPKIRRVNQDVPRSYGHFSSIIFRHQIDGGPDSGSLKILELAQY